MLKSGDIVKMNLCVDAIYRHRGSKSGDFEQRYSVGFCFYR